MTASEAKDMYFDMKNDELIQLIGDLELKVEAKNPNKPNKNELVETLVKYKIAQDEINGIKDNSLEEEMEADVAKAPITISTITERKLTPAQKLRIKIAELNIKERVLVHDTITSQTRDELALVRWGNRGMGYQRDYVMVTGKNPQYIRKGALDVLRAPENTIQEYVQDDFASPLRLTVRPRYTIVPLDGLTEEEIKVLATQQNLRNAKFAV